MHEHMFADNVQIHSSVAVMNRITPCTYDLTHAYPEVDSISHIFMFMYNVKRISTIENVQIEGGGSFCELELMKFL